jgi:hypothetical protein
VRAYFKRKGGLPIKAIWAGEAGYSWNYETAIPHETFEVVENGLPYCLGLGFNLADVAKMLAYFMRETPDRSESWLGTRNRADASQARLARMMVVSKERLPKLGEALKVCLAWSTAYDPARRHTLRRDVHGRPGWADPRAGRSPRTRAALTGPPANIETDQGPL